MEDIMAIKVAINGFGRIGRLVVRQGISNPDIEFVAINDLVSPDNLAYMLRYDSTHGQFKGEVSHDEENIYVNGKKIRCTSIRDPKELPWKELGVDYVFESTGLFTSTEGASQHLEAGAGRVIISAPAKSPEITTLVMGVNHTEYKPDRDRIVSNASCTTNCLAPVMKVILDKFGFDEGLMTTVHAATATQPIVDGPSKKDFRAGRSGLQNITPASTGAAKAVGLCLPETKGKLTGMAFRVPTADVSAVDLTLRLSRPTSMEEINKEMKLASETYLKGVLMYTEDPVASTDFIGCPYSSIYDATAGIGLNDRFFKLVSWYDNETGYATRLVDLMLYMNSVS
jgi:glyceraldehyde 3-phosphate dehydrogenase